jgi:hypothetical protein
VLLLYFLNQSPIGEKSLNLVTLLHRSGFASSTSGPCFKNWPLIVSYPVVPKLGHFEAGLPDGIFSDQKPPFGLILGGSWNGKCWYTYVWSFGIVYSPLVYFMTICYDNLV